MKRILFILVILAMAQAASAQDWAKEKLAKSPRHFEWVTVKHDGRSVDTFVVYPELKDKRPVVLIIHEISGMTEWVQDLADQVAEAGYIAVAPDLLSGMGPNGGRSSSFEPGKANEAVSKLNPDQVTADLNAVADYGKKLPASNGKLFVGGFCWGVGKRSALRRIVPTLLRRSFSMGRRQIRMRWSASKPRCMDSLLGMTRASAR